MTSSISPGWYDDPATPGMERWWDGSQWTESTRPATTPPPSPPATPPPPAPPPPASAASPAPAAAGPAPDAAPEGAPGSGPNIPGPPNPATAPTSSAAIPGPPPGGSGSPYQPYGGYPSAPPGDLAAGTSGGPTRNRGARNALIAGAALLVVGGIIAALVILLGGDDGDPEAKPSGPTATTATSASASPSASVSPSTRQTPTPAPDTDGTVTDAESGVTLPAMRDWTVPPGDPETHQVTGQIPCTGSETASPDTQDPCYLGEINLGVFEGTSFDAMVSELQGDVASNDSFTTTSIVKDEGTTVDGKNAHLLVIEVEEKATGASGTPRAARFQYVVIDMPLTKNGKQGYPVVFVGVDNDPAAPPDSVFDTILRGIEIGTPSPAAS